MGVGSIVYNRLIGDKGIIYNRAIGVITGLLVNK